MKQDSSAKKAKKPNILIRLLVLLITAALVVGALGYFLCLSLQTAWKAARGEDPSARQTAWASLWAAILVFCSSVVRLEDLLRIAGADGDGGAAPADRPICDREV